VPDALQAALAQLTDRERFVMVRRFGLDEGEPRERVRQIEMIALQKLRHPTRAGRLRAFVG
jgi:RNA polymerase primary sigma factor